MRAALRKLESFAAFDALPIHIGGESGTGKELVARWVHEKSSRARRNFVAVNCASLPDGLVEAELFGHTRGAFTGATQAREGLVAHADGGTLFLDEVADLPPRAQTALLRALQEKEYRRLGEAGLRRSDFRLISASHKNLSEEVQRGRVSAGPLLSFESRSRRASRAPRAARRHSSTCRALCSDSKPCARSCAPRVHSGGGATPGTIWLAGQRTGARE